MKKYNLGFGHLGNGITVWNKLEEVHGDYKKIAHIDTNRKVEYYDNLPKDIISIIDNYAKTDDSNITFSQEQKIFNTRPSINI